MKPVREKWLYTAAGNLEGISGIMTKLSPYFNQLAL